MQKSQSSTTRSWIAHEQSSHFPIQNLPFGIFSVGSSNARVGVAIGDMVIDLYGLHGENLLNNVGFNTEVFGDSTLNRYMALNSQHWNQLRHVLTNLLLDHPSGDKRLREDIELQKRVLFKQTEVTMHMPAIIGDYTDFYSSKEHATNVGVMFRGVDNALQPNWLHLPVGYHGRSSSVVLSGTEVPRPKGQIIPLPLLDSATTSNTLPNPNRNPIHSECNQLDFELEIACFIGNATDGKAAVNKIGDTISITEADDHIFGVVLMNDWSARDIQSFEYVPLGPFTAKNFCTSISPWVVPFAALDPFRCCSSEGPLQVAPVPLPYLQDKDYATSFFNIYLQVSIKPAGDERLCILTRTNARHLYWSFKQQLVHHSVSGCPMRVGDLLGSGTISGATADSFGSLLELSWKGSRDVPLIPYQPLESVSSTLKNVESVDSTIGTRQFLLDGDMVVMAGYAEGDGFRVGFGEVLGKIVPCNRSSK